MHYEGSHQLGRLVKRCVLLYTLMCAPMPYIGRLPFGFSSLFHFGGFLFTVYVSRALPLSSMACNYWYSTSEVLYWHRTLLFLLGQFFFSIGKWLLLVYFIRFAFCFLHLKVASDFCILSMLGSIFCHVYVA